MLDLGPKSNDRYPSKRKVEGDLRLRQTRKEATWRPRQRLEMCSQKPRNTWSPQKLEGVWKDCSLKSSEGACQHPEFRLLNNTSLRKRSYCSKPHSLWEFVMAALGEMLANSQKLCSHAALKHPFFLAHIRQPPESLRKAGELVRGERALLLTLTLRMTHPCTL